MDKGENIRREICLCLEEMGVNPEASHHEQGPGQNEVTFKFSDALEAADNLLTFKSAVKAIAERNGLFASLYAQAPSEQKRQRVACEYIAFTEWTFNIFRNTGKQSAVAEHFIARIQLLLPK